LNHWRQPDLPKLQPFYTTRPRPLRRLLEAIQTTTTGVVVSIAAKMLAGARALRFADRDHFNLNLTDLLDKSTQCKKNWLLNVLAARQRNERQQAGMNSTVCVVEEIQSIPL